MVRQVRGTGTLVPEQIRWIPAATDGTVEWIVIRPGALVSPDTVTQLKTARLQADADGQLFTRGIVSSHQLQQSHSAEQEFDTRYALEQGRLQMATDTVEAQLAVEQAEVDRLRTLYELRQ